MENWKSGYQPYYDSWSLFYKTFPFSPTSKKNSKIPDLNRTMIESGWAQTRIPLPKLSPWFKKTQIIL